MGYFDQQPSPWGGVQLGQVDPNDPNAILAMLQSGSQPQLALQQQMPQAPMMPPAPANVPRGTQSQSQSVAVRTRRPSPNLPPPQSAQDMLNNLSSADLTQQGVDRDALRKRLEDLQGKALPMDFSPLAALTDAWTGSNFSKTYHPEETAKTRDEAIQKLQDAIAGSSQNITKDKIRMLQAAVQNQQDIRKTDMMDNYYKGVIANGQDKNAIKGATGGQALNKEIERFGHEMVAGNASSRNGMGQNQKTITAATKIHSLGQQGDFQKDGLTLSQMHDLSLATANLVSNGNAATEYTVKSLVPETYRDSATKLEQWLKAEPLGAKQQLFTQQMLETADREGHNAVENIREIQSDIIAGHPSILNDPRAQVTIKHHFGMGAKLDPNTGEIIYDDPTQFSQYGNYVRKDYVPGQTNWTKSSFAAGKGGGGKAPAAATPDIKTMSREELLKEAGL